LEASTIQLQDLLWIYSNQDRVVFVEEQTNSSMEQATELRNKPNGYKYSQLIFDKGAKGIPWSKDSLLTNGPGNPQAKKKKQKKN
jgi:hypothetical protein